MNTESMVAKKRFDWRVFAILWFAGIVGLIAIVPYSLALQAPALAKAQLPVPLEILIPIQLAQNAVILAVVVGIGLLAANRVGLGAPILEAWLAHQPIGDKVRAILLPSVILGVFSAIAIILLDLFLFSPGLQAQMGPTAASAAGASRPTAWQGLLASFYGGIDEELQTRLFLLSLFAFAGKFVSHTAVGHPTLSVLWTANISVAILFGLGHLPMTSVLVSLTPLVIVRAIVLNGLAGLAFGYLYFTRGLESAMLSHFSADLVLHVLFAI